ncbi:MAG: hypothetical protein KatS3mg104_0093 [Phycisphaerae bacterium]|jgi:prepilin-type N-terminal cleavage/methylation domain-containing protein|nr:MAG: hypothetical protein KatS3mg104_0093 [Phycisphaerae bacterium]
MITPRPTTRYHRAHARPRAFTLTELLVVIGLIVLLITIAIPTFSVLRGNNSIENAINVVSASLARARSEAIGLQRPFGIAFYREQASGRYAMALVELKSVSIWTPNTPYNIGDWVKTGTSPNYSYFVCQTAHTSGNTFDASSWQAIHPTTNGFLNNGYPPVERVDGSERLLLPIGLSAASINVNASSPETIYSDTGLILFDENGMLTSRQVVVAQESELYRQIDDSATGPGTQVASQIGLMLFEDERFKSETEGQTPSAKQTWIDNNGTPLLVNRYNATVVKGE